ncbi:tetratricopeptide repeat protein [Vicingaceae bacterium]|nr:tetratricopeptide repeat protein [Vicingaceae bacterium]
MFRKYFHYLFIAITSLQLLSCGSAGREFQQQADALVKTNDLTNAIPLYTQSLELDSSLFGSFYNRGFCFYELGQYENALLDYSSAIKLDDENFQAHFNQALCLIRLQNIKGALNSLSKAEKNNSSNPDVLLQKANCFFKLGAYKNAADYYSKALPHFEDSSIIYFTRGSSYYQIGSYELALKDLSKYLNTKNSPLLAYEYAAISAFEIDSFEICINYFAQEIELGQIPVGENLKILVTSLVKFGIIQLEQNNMEKAMELFTYAISVDPLNKDAYYNRGLILLDMGKRFDACEDFNQALTNGHPNALEPMKHSCPEYFQ